MGMGPLENAASAVEAAAAVEAALLPSAAAAAAAVPAEPSAAGSYAVLQCGEDSEYVRKAYSGYFQVFRALLEEDGEAWRVYRAPRGELPTDAEAAGFDGFVISGSCADAHGDEPWILALVDLIRRLHAAGKRILGVCFGHQEPERMAGVGRGKRRGWPAAQELDRMRARQVQRLATPELKRRRARSVAVGGGRPCGSPSGCGCGRWRRPAAREPKQQQVWVQREQRAAVVRAREQGDGGRGQLRAVQEGGRQPVVEASPRDGDG